MWDIAKKPISVLMDPHFLLFFIYSGSKQSTANRRPDGRVTWLARYSPERHLFGCSIDFVGKFTNNLWNFIRWWPIDQRNRSTNIKRMKSRDRGLVKCGRFLLSFIQVFPDRRAKYWNSSVNNWWKSALSWQRLIKCRKQRPLMEMNCKRFKGKRFFDLNFCFERMNWMNEIEIVIQTKGVDL